MDFITHALMGVGAARLLAPSREKIPQYCLAGLLGSLLPDADSWLVFFGPNAYGFYHRVITHSAVGLVCIGSFAGFLAFAISVVPRARRYGWLVAPNLAAESPTPDRTILPALIWTAMAVAAIHWWADFITGFGNLKPFWPWSQRQVALHAVQSFDVVIFTATLAWHLLVRNMKFPRWKEAWIGLAYAFFIIAYVALKRIFGTPTVW